MTLGGVRTGFAVTGSFCTFDIVLKEMKNVCEAGAEIYPILSFNAAGTDTRFMKCADLRAAVEGLAGRPAIDTIVEAEPLGPKKMLDILIVAPCTGNTLAKIASGVTDTPVTMAVKGHLRNERPVLIAVSTNDGLSANAKNLGLLLNTKNVFFVPFRQDNYTKKSNSLVAEMSAIIPAAEFALEYRQMQPVLLAGYGS